MQYLYKTAIVCFIIYPSILKGSTDLSPETDTDPYIKQVHAIINIAPQLSPQHSRTMAARLTRLYFLLTKDSAIDEATAALARTTARDLWLKDYETENAIKLKSIAEALMQLKFYQEAISVYKHAAAKSLTPYFIETITTELKKLGYNAEALDVRNEFLTRPRSNYYKKITKE